MLHSHVIRFLRAVSVPTFVVDQSINLCSHDSGVLSPVEDSVNMVNTDSVVTLPLSQSPPICAFVGKIGSPVLLCHGPMEFFETRKR